MLLSAPEDSRADDDWLVARHLETCPDCSAVAAALARLRRELPILSEADPGEDFVHSVIAATSGAPSEPKRRPGARLQRHIERLIRRPRIALEGAYAIAMAVLMVVGLGVFRLCARVRLERMGWSGHAKRPRNAVPMERKRIGHR
jgi:anti-sigma factor RsiW